MHFDRPGIQEGLERRGWIRKISSTIDAGAEDTSFRDPDSDTVVTLPYAVTPTFIWVHFGLPYTLLEEDQILNFFANINCFTSKAGLCVTLKRLRMFTDVNADTFFPRCYDLTEKKGKQLFVDDFMATAARSILKWVIRRNQKTSQVEETTTDGCTSIESVPVETILAAFKICKMCLGISENDDIDKECEEMDTDWTEFRERYYRVIHDGADIENSASHVDRCCSVLHKIKAIHPQLDIDGERNIWILKPAFLSQGRDIMCMNRLNDIIDHVEDTQCSSFEKRWVIQKYIERPLLIYETKFDVRQFFLVTDWEPLTIWFYKVNYIRFSSQPFNLENLDRSIHLCNRSIQKYLTNAPNRHPDLPEINVWSNKRMQEYLRMIGAEHAYEEVMMPGMKKALLHTLQACQDTVYKRENSFDFYGADFMFGEDFQPWLIEINFRPDLSSPSEVTEGIFKNLLEDILKVVLDRKTDPNCDTGAFELIQEQP
ncbi:tubulin monoglycylase TTLL3 [Xenopus tropicalis]|uniref:Tubulin monoglycylase TTLL3 n=1 Tax=Xenopus tropicalis TaxID=8364 RepID=A0A8J0SMD6_XENTR|nr:tubulin monoglycylase TTLL3 [Xenopus tropicalis]